MDEGHLRCHRDGLEIHQGRQDRVLSRGRPACWTLLGLFQRHDWQGEDRWGRLQASAWRQGDDHPSSERVSTMTEISTAKLYNLYLDTVGRCTSELRNRSDEAIEYDLFEEFDAGVHSFLHDDNLAKLRHAGLIDDEMLAVSR